MSSSQFISSYTFIIYALLTERKRTNILKFDIFSPTGRKHFTTEFSLLSTSPHLLALAVLNIASLLQELRNSFFDSILMKCSKY